MRSLGGASPLLVLVLGALVGCGSASKLPPGALASGTVAPLCGPAGDWSASTLADAALGAAILPSPWAITGGGPQAPADVLGSAAPTPAGGNLLAAYRRHWEAGTTGSAVVELYAFDTDAAANDFALHFLTGFAGRGVDSTASAVVPGATEYVIHGAAGDDYNVVAERVRVVMHLTIGGPDVTQATMESLASRQYDRLCQH